MGVILRAAGEGKFLTAAEIYDLVPYRNQVTFGAIRFSIRLLEKQALVERQKQGRNTVVIPTERGYCWFQPAPPVTTGP